MEDENFAIEICDSIDSVYRQHFELWLKIIVAKYEAISTGNQFGGGSSEYFFHVELHFLDSLKREIEMNIPYEFKNHIKIR